MSNLHVYIYAMLMWVTSHTSCFGVAPKHLNKPTKGETLNLVVNIFLHIQKSFFSKEKRETYCFSLSFWIFLIFYFKLDPLWWLLNYLEMRKEEQRREVERKLFWHHLSLPIQRSLITTLLLQIQGNFSHTQPPTEWTQVKTCNFRIYLIFTSLLVTFKAAEKNISNKLLKYCVRYILLFKYLTLSLWLIWENNGIFALWD